MILLPEAQAILPSNQPPSLLKSQVTDLVEAGQSHQLCFHGALDFSSLTGVAPSLNHICNFKLGLNQKKGGNSWASKDEWHTMAREEVINRMGFHAK